MKILSFRNAFSSIILLLGVVLILVFLTLVYLGSSNGLERFGLIGQKKQSEVTYASENLLLIADAYVNDAKPQSNFGTSTTLVVDNDPDVIYAYLKFDLGVLAGKTVTSAKLRFKTTESPNSGSRDTLKVKYIPDTNWQENTLNWRNRPQLSSIVLGSISNAAANSWYEVPLKLATVQTNAGKLFSIAIKSEDKDDLLISSRETQSPAQLIVEYSSANPTASPSSVPSPTSSSQPTTPPVGGIWTPSLNTSWQWQLEGLPVDQSVDASMFDIDLFDNDKSIVDSLHAKGKKVVCYLSAGSFENWRPDAGSFPDSVKGNNNGWEGEKWLDIRQVNVLIPIMEKRMDLCKTKGFDAIEADNVDGYTNRTGFPLSYQDQLNYNKSLADAAHARGFSIALKNDIEQVNDLLPYFDWALNEECFKYNECDVLKAFINAGKAVFQVEYNMDTSQFCPKANSMNFNSMKKKLNLDASRTPCR